MHPALLTTATLLEQDDVSTLVQKRKAVVAAGWLFLYCFNGLGG